MILKSAVALAVLVCGAGCGGWDAGSGASGRGIELHAVSMPDVSRLDQSVQAQVRGRHEALARVLENEGSTPADLADAFGRLGMVLDAADYHDAAEPAYLNAQTLAPGDGRWPYYLAHLYRAGGNTAGAKASFGRVLELVPNHPPSLAWLGRLHLEEGDAIGAEPLFGRAREADPRLVAAVAGLGQAALARRDYARAASLLEEALSLDPSAASLHSPLASAYRALGDMARATAHLQQWRNTDIVVPDRWRQELDLTLESGLSYELRGIRALERRDFAAAAGFFRAGAALEPGTTGLGRSLRHKLATALYLDGDAQAAIERFQEVVRLSPATPPDETAARAHYSLGVLMAARGNHDEALAHLETAVEYGPNYVEALQALGDALRRGGRARDALEPYRRAFTADAGAADARFGFAMALVRLGRHRDALDALSDAARRHAGHPEFREAMARLLAASPDDEVRDGERAMALVDGLIAGEKTIRLGETTAMALAETGNYEEAAAVLRRVMQSARASGLAYDRARMTVALRRYERHLPNRTPWADDDPWLVPPRAAGETMLHPVPGPLAKASDAQRR